MYATNKSLGFIARRRINALLKKYHIPLEGLEEKPQRVKEFLQPLMEDFSRQKSSLADDLHHILSFCASIQEEKRKVSGALFGSTREFPTGIRLYFYLKKRGDLQAEVLENTPKALVIGYPDRSYPYQEFHIRGKQASLVLVHEDVLHTLMTKVIHENRSTDTPQIFLKHTDKIDVVSRRKYPRMTVDLPMKFFFFRSYASIKNGEPPLLEKEGSMQNISQGGMKLVTELDRIPSVFIQATTRDPFTPPFSAKGRIRKQLQNKDQSISLHIQFLDNSRYTQIWIQMLQLGFFFSVSESS